MHIEASLNQHNHIKKNVISITRVYKKTSLELKSFSRHFGNLVSSISL